MRRHGFRAMGTAVSLISDERVGPSTFGAAARVVEQAFEDGERRFSRFRTESELSAVNAGAGAQRRVSEPFAALVGFALERAAATGGLFDPTVLGAVMAAGYDRDFDDIVTGAVGELHPPVPCGRWREISLRGRQLRLPSGVGLDLGGVAKGWTVDLAARATLACGLPWALVNAGGDLRLVGDAPTVEVAVEAPGSDEEVARLALSDGAVATSCTRRRSWGPGLHHLIDPRTGSPADTGVDQATVWAPTCALAEIAAKQALLEGYTALGRGPTVLVTAGGDIHLNLEPAGAGA